MDMAADRERTGRLEPLPVVEEPEVVLDLRMAKIVPVTDMQGVKPAEEVGHLALARNCLIMLTIFDTELDPLGSGVIGQIGEAIENPLDIRFGEAFPASHSGKLLADKRSLEYSAILNNLSERGG